MIDGSELHIARSHETLRTKVQDRIRASILDGLFRPGAKLIERELCELTGVSRPVLREALVHLEARGLIERTPNKGFRVARVSVAEVHDIYELRATLEGVAARLCAERASDELIEDLLGSVDALGSSFEDGSLKAIRTATARFYDLVFEGCGNRELKRALEGALDRVFYLRAHSMSHPGRREASMQEIRAIAEAIAQRDPAEAEQTSLLHVEAAKKAVLQRLRPAELAESAEISA